jgi:hypothetical protein
MSAHDVLSEFVTREELADDLGKHPRTLDRWNALGIGPPRTKIGRNVLYRRSSIQKWLIAREEQPER